MSGTTGPMGIRTGSSRRGGFLGNGSGGNLTGIAIGPGGARSGDGAVSGISTGAGKMISPGNGKGSSRISRRCRKISSARRRCRSSDSCASRRMSPCRPNASLILPNTSRKNLSSTETKIKGPTRGPVGTRRGVSRGKVGAGPGAGAVGAGTPGIVGVVGVGKDGDPGRNPSGNNAPGSLRRCSPKTWFVIARAKAWPSASARLAPPVPTGLGSSPINVSFSFASCEVSP